MAQEPVQIKQHIDAERERLGYDLEEIEHRMKDAFDWRTWYESNTVVMLGAAAAGGFLISLLVNSESNSPNTGYEAPVQPAYAKPKSNTQLSRLGDALETTMAALVGVGASKLQDMIAEAVPGFREKFQEAQHQRTSQY